MLGLQSSISSSSFMLSPSFSYESDFSSGVEGWAATSVEGTLTLASNANPYDDLGGSAPDSDGWLRGTYDTNQTNSSGLIKGGLFSSSPGGSIGDHAIIIMDIYLPDDSGKWGSAAPIKTVVNDSIGIAQQYQVPLDTLTTATFTGTESTDTAYNGNIILLWSDSSDLPQNGARFYLKNIKIDVFKLNN